MKSKAFTLIELLVVIVIIGILATISVSTFSGYFSKARDAIRLNDISNLHTALALYSIANEGYPEWQGPDIRESSCFAGGGFSDAVGQWSSSLQGLVDGGFINGLPNDPLGDPSEIGSNGNDFCFTYHRNITSTSLFDACEDKLTGALLLPRDYEYLIYFSLENSNDSPHTLHWNNNPPNSRPARNCSPGPLR